MKTKDLQPKYRLKNIWWNIWVKHILNIVAFLWNCSTTGPIIAYPLRIDIELGTMRQYYFKYGFKAVFDRCWTYNKVIISRLSGKQKEEDLSFFGLTGSAKLNAELNAELHEISSETVYLRKDKKTGKYKPHYNKVGYND